MKRPFFHLAVALPCSLLGLSMMAGPIQATSITLGNLEITRVKPGVPNWTWTSPSMVNTNKVPQNDPLQATVDISYSFSAQQQALINDDSGYTYSQKLWFDADRTFLGFGDKALAKTVTKYTFHAGGPTTLVYAPPGFTITQFGALSDGDSRADFEIEASNGRTFSLDPETKEVWLEPKASVTIHLRTWTTWTRSKRPRLRSPPRGSIVSTNLVPPTARRYRSKGSTTQGSRSHWRPETY
jgi:hypothetical protein